MSARADYGGRPPVSAGGVVAAVDPGGPAARAGIEPGERILEAEGRTLTDVLDWAWVADDERVEAAVESRAGELREVVLTRDFGEAWGLEFSAVVFDRVRTCRNDCAFCFMSQLPRGLRPSLYLRDDDYRLSFLQGNFITLTNLSDKDVARIEEMHLSPLHVSLHAVSPEVREQLVCARDSDRALERFDELLEAGIEMHVQIVLVPGLNDGAELERTLGWLAERDGVASIGIVPLGFTGHQERFSASFDSPKAAGAVIDQVAPWQVAFRERDGIGTVYLADEFYLNAGRELPEWDAYDGAPQYENGIGMTRAFLEGASGLLREFRASVDPWMGDARVTYVTGTLFAPVLGSQLAAVHEISGARPRVLAVANSFFGGNVDVAGLLVGDDIARAIAEDGAHGLYLLPDVVLNADGVTLDDLTVAELAERSGADVRLVSSDPAGLLPQP